MFTLFFPGSFASSRGVARRRTARRFLCAAAIALIAFGSDAAAIANPSHRQIDAGIAVFSDGAKTMATEAQGHYEAGRKASIEVLEAASNNQIARLQPATLATAYTNYTLTRRIGERLRLLGEPAGVDYTLRAAHYQAEVFEVIRSYRGLPTSERFVNGIRTKMGSQAAARQKALMNIQRLVQQQMWQEAETALLRVFDVLEPDVIFLSDGERAEIVRPFQEVQGAINAAMLQLRRQAAATTLAELRQANVPNLGGLVAELGAAADAIGQTGTAALGESAATGPQAAAHFLDRWRDAHAGVLRIHAIDWAIQSNGYGTPFQVGGVDVPAWPPAAEYGKFCNEMLAGLARLIDEDAKRLADTEAAARHGEYVAALAPLAGRLTLLRGTNGLEAALQRLADRSPAFGAQATAYRQATDELLRWREKTAKAQAAARLKAYPSLETTFFDATVSRGEIPYVGLFPGANVDSSRATLLAAAPVLLPHAIQQLSAKRVTAVEVKRLPGEARFGISAFRSRCYANAPAPLDVAAQIADLEADLLIGAGEAPLSLDAAASLDGAGRNDWEAIGGEIVGAHLEGTIPRFASVPPMLTLMVDIDAVNSERRPGEMLDQVQMRFELRPEWVQHKHFFVQLAAPPDAQARR